LSIQAELDGHDCTFLASAAAFSISGHSSDGGVAEYGRVKRSRFFRLRIKPQIGCDFLNFPFHNTHSLVNIIVSVTDGASFNGLPTQKGLAHRNIRPV
jgi:hypothetical protein